MISNSSFSSNLSAIISEQERGGQSIGAALRQPATSISFDGNHLAFNDPEDFEEPPVSLMVSGNVSLNGLCFHMPLNHTNPTKISPSFLDTKLGRSLPHVSLRTALPDLSVSPLTSSSFHVMEREYDRDTWRMFNRITSSRIEKSTMRIAENTEEAQHDDKSELHLFPTEEEFELEEDNTEENDFEAIFDLDLE
jgi:hypothetical protein